ncbi:MAG: DNA recombination protein RmuC [Candidatus Cloacimonetes bacterium]|nr:DNA recombination protein RmuC [Candidatus Cloacimonadota bacterium]
MPTSTFLILSLIISGFAAVIYFINQRFQKLEESSKKDEAMKVMSDWMKQIAEQTQVTRKEMQDRLETSSKMTNERLDNAAKVIAAVQKSLGQVGEVNRRIEEFQEALRAPKTRGEVGERVMYDLLKQVIPQQYLFLQHQFKNGQIVDAAVKTNSGVIPIDSKFPVENYKKMVQAKSDTERESAKKDFTRDVKKHIDDIAKKYILPDEDTVDFAVMYVNSEPVAYEVVVNIPELAEYAHKRRVVVVSPQQFNHFLSLVYTTLQIQQINQQAQFVLNAIKGIRQDAGRFSEDFRVLVKHISNAKNMADTASSSFSQLTSKIESAESLGAPLESETLSLGT